MYRALQIGNMRLHAWRIDGRRWPDHARIMVAQGARVVCDIVNRIPLERPILQHGHHFQMLVRKGRPLRAALRAIVPSVPLP